MLYLIVVLSALCFYYIYSKTKEPVDYWRRKRIFHVYDPTIRFLKEFFGTKSIFETVRDGYREFPDKRYFGSYNFFKPALVVRDVDLIKQITMKDFDYFPDHFSFGNNPTDDLIGQNLFSLEGEKWRDMRSNLSPAFTSSKMRYMYVLMQEVAENFIKHYDRVVGKNVTELEVKKAFTKYTNDVIATCVFGVQCDSFKDENNEFFLRGKLIAEPGPLTIFKTMFFALIPQVFEFFKIPIIPSFITEFFRSLVKETIGHREKNGVVRPDMIHLLMEARKGQLQHDQNPKTSEPDTGFATVEESEVGKTRRKMELTDDVITAQGLVFFIAGFDSSSTLLSFLTYHVAIYPEVQRQLQEEIDAALAGRTISELSYEELLRMKYLDQVVSETLRLYPSGFFLTRMCRKNYTIKAKHDDEVDFQLDSGILVTIPVCGIHRDPKYFPNPDKFDPDRFSDENKGNIVPGSYMPFGSGPRNCIGSRFALLETKILVVGLFSRFDLVPIQKTTIPLQLSKNFNLTVKGGIWLGLKKRQI